MNEFKVGDKVEITGPTTGGDRSFIGSISVTESPVYLARPDVFAVEVQPSGWNAKFVFPLSSLRLVTALALAPGMRVKTTQDSRPSFRRGQIGEVTTAVQVNGHQCWRVEFPDTADREYFTYEADELEVLPDPEPQPAEVWRHNGTGWRYVVIEVGKQKEAGEWHAAVMYRPQLEGQMYSRRLESFLQSFTRS